MNQTVIAPQRLELSVATTQKGREWLDMVLTACYTVSLHSAKLITATTVSASSEGLNAVERHELLDLAREIATEQNLWAELEDDGSHLVARFSRLAPVRVITPDATEVAAQAPREEGASTPQPAGSFLNPVWRFAHRAGRGKGTA